MARQVVELSALTIASGQTTPTSPAYIPNGGSDRIGMQMAISYIIYAPATLPETVTVQVAPVKAPAAGDWRDLSVAGADVVVTAGDAVEIPAAEFKALRLSAGGAVAANRAFRILAQLDIG